MGVEGGGWRVVVVEGFSEDSQLFLERRLVLHNGWEVDEVIHLRHLHPSRTRTMDPGRRDGSG